LVGRARETEILKVKKKTMHVGPIDDVRCKFGGSSSEREKTRTARISGTKKENRIGTSASSCMTVIWEKGGKGACA